MWLMKTLLTSGCTNQRGAGQVLRFLAGKPDGVPARNAHEAAADTLNLDDNQRAEVIASGQLVYKNRAVGHMFI